MAYVMSFEDPNATLLETSGGKGSSLARLVEAGFPVPEGFVVTTDAYREFITDNNLVEGMSRMLASIDFADPQMVEAVTEKIRASIVAAPISDRLAKDILSSYEALGVNVFVAVRSSGTAEDLAEASFAGQHDSYLDIQGSTDVLDAVRRCWASLWTARATAYRHQKGFDQSVVRLAVVVQKMVASEVSGVMFTANPMTTATNEMVINAGWGLGEGIVSGILTPDQFIVERDTEISSRLVDRILGRGVLPSVKLR